MERRLAAILAADVVGYSRLMGADETGTLVRLKSLRADAIDPVIADHNGRIVKLMGDGALVEFPSVVAAVECAVEIQRRIAEHTAEDPENRRMAFRIGVNLGDVIVEGDDIYGDGVNIAARLQELAEPGGVCISGSVFEQVKGKLGAAFDDMGRQNLKNIAEPVRAYRVATGDAGRDAIAESTEPPPLPDKPSIAVLPFTNMSGDPEQEYFSDGITEDIITALSRIPELFVIARNSTFTYKGRAVDVTQAARELGVRYVLEGSVRKAGVRVRVTAQLIDGDTGDHDWAERYDRDLEDIFAVQDEITRNIVLAMQIKLTYGELARLWEGQTQNLKAWEKMVQGRDLFLRFNAADNSSARRLLEEALALDPDYTGAMVQLGLTHWWDARFLISGDRERCLALAEEQVEKILKLDPHMGGAYMLRGGIAFVRDQHEDAVRLCQKAVELAPSDSWATAYFGFVCVYAGESEKAIAALKAAMRLSPYYPNWYTYNLATAYLWAGDYAAAQGAAKAHLEREPDDPYSYANVATIFAFQGRDHDAVRTISELKSRFPAFGVQDIILSQRYKERDRLDRIVEALRKAGLPD